MEAAAMRFQQPRMGFRSRHVYVLQGLPMPVYVGEACGASDMLELPTVHFDLNTLRRCRGSLVNTKQDLVDLYLAKKYIRHIMDMAVNKKAKSILITDTAGGKWSNALAYMLLREPGGLSSQQAAKAQRLASLHRYRVVDNVETTVHIWGEPDHIELLNMLHHQIGEPEGFPSTYEPNDFMEMIHVASAANHPAPPPPLTLARLPVVGQRCMYVMGTINQFSYAHYRPSAFACGSIAIYACLLSEWLHPRTWRSKEIDSVVLCGLWHARRYPDSTTGHNDTPEQIKSLCPEVYYRPQDVTDHTGSDGRVGWLEKLKHFETAPEMTRLLLTHMSPGAVVGHHTFLAHEGGYWYWLEPMRCSSTTLSTSSDFAPPSATAPRNSAFEDEQTGSVLRIFDSLHALAGFAEKELSGKYWTIVHARRSRFSMVPHHFYEAPRRVIYTQFGEVKTNHLLAQPMVIEQDPATSIWHAIAHIDHDTNQVTPLDVPLSKPFQLVMQPHFSVLANVALPVGTMIHIRDAKFQDQPCANGCNYGTRWIDQSPFDDPAIWVTNDSLSVLVGHKGAWIVYYMRRSKERSNTIWTQGGAGLYLMVTQPIRAGMEIFRPIMHA